MKKQYPILSVMFALVLSFFLASCGAKKDETLVTEFNAKKSEADKIMTMTDADMKVMKTDHAAWSTKLDSVGKLPKADAAKIDGFRAEMKKHEDMAKNTAQMISDSVKAAENAKTDNNDQLKSATAGLDAQMAAANTNWKSVMDAHKKLGADITAFLGAENAETPKEEAAEHGKKASTTTTTSTPPTNEGGMDVSKHPVKPTTTPTPRRGGGATIIKK